MHPSQEQECVKGEGIHTVFSTCLVFVKSPLAFLGNDATAVLSEYLEVLTLDTGISHATVIVGVDVEEGVRTVTG